jgi:hypothetical protein
MPHKFVGNTVDRESMKLFGARANERSTDLALKNAARNILRSRLNLLIEVRHSLHVVQFSRACEFARRCRSTTTSRSCDDSNALPDRSRDVQTIGFADFAASSSARRPRRRPALRWVQPPLPAKPTVADPPIGSDPAEPHPNWRNDGQPVRKSTLLTGLACIGHGCSRQLFSHHAKKADSLNLTISAVGGMGRTRLSQDGEARLGGVTPTA